MSAAAAVVDFAALKAVLDLMSRHSESAGCDEDVERGRAAFDRLRVIVDAADEVRRTREILDLTTGGPWTDEQTHVYARAFVDFDAAVRSLVDAVAQ